MSQKLGIILETGIKINKYKEKARFLLFVVKLRQSQ